MGLEFNIVRGLALEAFSNLQNELDVIIEVEIVDSTNILNILDSMDVVNLIMETESLVEAKVGYYVPLANEKSFDAEVSPLISCGEWVKYIMGMIEECYE